MPHTMTFSPREREVLETIRRSEAVGFNTLAHHFADRFSADELDVVIKRLEDAGMIVVVPSTRTHVISLTREGRQLLKELLRG